MNNLTAVPNDPSISLSTPPSCPHFVRTKGNIQKVKYRLHPKEKSISSETVDGSWHFRQKCLANDEKRFIPTSL